MSPHNHSIFKFQNADSESPIPFKNEDRPLVILLGWMGSKPNQLDKYASQYRKRGFNTFSFCSEPSQLLIPGVIQNKGNQMIEQIKKYLKENQQCKSIIFKAMSNGGGFYYAHIVAQIHSREDCKWIKPYIKGACLDSLPAIRPLSIFTAFKMTSPNIVVTFFLALLVPLIVLLFSTHMTRYQNSLTNSKNNWQHLIFYSKDDIIVHSDDIDQLIVTLKNNLSNSNLIDYKCFDKSPHVLHLKTHPEIYEEKLDNFINSIKKNFNNK